ncbi:MAG: TetR/AcrR family transcriptional regulator [Nannocystaceae bacterium]|nr:TetR/AcrR family transcriptional regulator [Nannocystaceae bacterium]
MTRHDTPHAARRRFFAAALKVCLAKGYTATRMSDIAEEAGRSKGALYHHFTTKKSLFVELVHDIVEQFTNTLDEGMLRVAPTRELIESATVALLESFRGIDLVGVFVELFPLAMRDPELRVPLLEYYRQSIETLARLLRWGQERAELRPDFDPRQTARALVLAGDGIILICTSLGETDRAASDFRELFRRVFDGLEVQR